MSGNMHEILPGLWVGNAYAARDRTALLEAGVDGVLRLLNLSVFFPEEEDANFAAAGIELKTVPLLDQAGNDPAEFVRAIATLDDLARRRRRVLVHCYAGCIRSAGIAAAHIVRRRFREVEPALALLAPEQAEAVEWAAKSEEDAFPASIRADPAFQRLALAFRLMRSRRPIVSLYAPMWVDMFPHTRDALR